MALDDKELEEIVRPADEGEAQDEIELPRPTVNRAGGATPEPMRRMIPGDEPAGARSPGEPSSSGSGVKTSRAPEECEQVPEPPRSSIVKGPPEIYPPDFYLPEHLYSDQCAFRGSLEQDRLRDRQREKGKQQMPEEVVEPLQVESEEEQLKRAIRESLAEYYRQMEAQHDGASISLQEPGGEAMEPPRDLPPSSDVQQEPRGEAMELHPHASSDVQEEM